MPSLPKAAQVHADEDETPRDRETPLDGRTEGGAATTSQHGVPSTGSEFGDTAAPPGQRVNDSAPTPMSPTFRDTQRETTENSNLIQSQLDMEDNRNALAIIKYEAKADPALFGYDTHNLYFLAFAMGERGNELSEFPPTSSMFPESLMLMER